MKSIILSILMTTFILAQSFACINEYNINLRGGSRMESFFDGIPILYRSFDVEFSKSFIAQYDLTKKEKYTYKELSDLSIQLCKVGRVEEALTLLKWLYSKHPNEYRITSNLGTAFELNGMVDSAKYYIEMAINRNADSHRGSEWVHLRILNAKQAIAKDKNWLQNNKILNLNYKEVEIHSIEDKLIYDSIQHIGYQLRERMPFTPTDDFLMAKILEEYGDYMGNHYSIRWAAVSYRIAKTYDKNNLLKLDAKLTNADKIVQKNMKMYEEKGTSKELFKRHFPPFEKFQKINRSKFPKLNKSKAKQTTNKVIAKTKPTPNYWVYGGVFLMILLAFGGFRLMKK